MWFVKFNVAHQWEEKNKLKQIPLIVSRVRDHFHSGNYIITQRHCIKDIKIQLKFEFSSLSAMVHISSSLQNRITHFLDIFLEAASELRVSGGCFPWQPLTDNWGPVLPGERKELTSSTVHFRLERVIYLYRLQTGHYSFLHPALVMYHLSAN